MESISVSTIMAARKYIRNKIIACKQENPTFSHRQIAKVVGCDQSTVTYHLNPDFRESTLLSMKKYRNTSRIDRKEFLVQQAGGKCGVCGYDKYAGALDFHHKDPKTKSFSISDMLRSNKGCPHDTESIIEETKKCMLLCANCHRELHGGVLILKH